MCNLRVSAPLGRNTLAKPACSSWFKQDVRNARNMKDKTEGCTRLAQLCTRTRIKELQSRIQIYQHRTSAPVQRPVRKTQCARSKANKDTWLKGQCGSGGYGWDEETNRRAMHEQLARAPILTSCSPCQIGTFCFFLPGGLKGLCSPEMAERGPTCDTRDAWSTEQSRMPLHLGHRARQLCRLACVWHCQALNPNPNPPPDQQVAPPDRFRFSQVRRGRTF